ncbi:hypothetical protein HF086_013059 [Spodoptera exigua]|uniref:RRM domain-containing protein n=1 Tax=Spodoptera exigua TaxID=7107 RepID=A0A922MJJ9_SPOEX|nr:hypothetical protein HF086_013059 [Spodoptera exigua]
MDAKPRELYLLFRAYEGYEGSLLKVTSKNGKTASPVGFVTFHTRAGAEAAKQDLQEFGPYYHGNNVQTPLTLGACVLPAPALGSPGAAVPAHTGPAAHPAHPAPPCSTLFVANLGQFVSEHELKEIFSSCPGFTRLRLLSGGSSGGGSSGPVAFVDFANPSDAATALARLQGALLLSSEGAIHLEFARHKMAHNGWILAHEGAKGGEEGEQH